MAHRTSRLPHLAAILVLGCAMAFSAARAEVLGNAACQALVSEGASLFSAGKLQEALAKYQQAAKEDPAASAPLSGIAQILFSASKMAQGAEAERLAKQARGVLQQALKLGPNDPMAQELWRSLDDTLPAPLHVASTDAAKLSNEGDALLFAKKYPEALEKYDAALRLDPQFSQAAVYAGDVFYNQNKWPEAEARFRQGVTIEPLNAQGWRFLSDALQAQGKTAEADKALLAGIAAQPSQLPNWDKLGVLRGKAGLPLTPLKLRMMARASVEPGTQKMNVTLDSALQQGGIDMSVWTVYGIAKAGALAASDKGPVRTPYAIELDAWKQAMAAAARLEKPDAPLNDPALATLLKLDRAGQLEPAILILAYRESYRPDWERWKAAHPNGVSAFIDNTGLRP